MLFTYHLCVTSAFDIQIGWFRGICFIAYSVVLQLELNATKMLSEPKSHLNFHIL